MGRRKKEPLFDIIIRLPWWMGAIGAGAALLARLAWISWIENTNALGMFASVVRQAHWLFYAMAVVMALGALGSLIRQWLNGRMLDRQAGAGSVAELDWRDFEQLMQEAFRRKGYMSVETPTGADGGVDIALRKDGKLYLVQCKHWKARKIGVATVRELFGVITARNASGGFLVTSGYFTEDAKAFAAQVKLELIDGPKLDKLISQVGKARQAGSTTETSPQRIEPVVTAPLECPKCGSEMVRRVARKGVNAGKEFWGCGEYPRCRGVIGMNETGVLPE
jgi:restriction system protein